MISTFYKKYRTMPTSYGNYVVQIWRLWFPFWIELGFCNFFPTKEEAIAFAKAHANPELL